MGGRGLEGSRGSGPAHAAPGSGCGGSRPPAPAPTRVRCARGSAPLRAMAGLLALLGPAGRVGARVGPRAPWPLGVATPYTPPPLLLPRLRPGPGAPLLRAARGHSRGHQVSLPTPTLLPGRPDPGPPPRRDSLARPAA